MDEGKIDISKSLTEDSQAINTLSRKLTFVARKHYNEEDIVNIRRALQLLQETCEKGNNSEILRKIHIQSLSIALVVIEEINLGTASVIASLFFKFEQNGTIPLQQIQKEFGDYQLNLMTGLRKISSIPLHQITSQANNFRELIISLANDVRVILISLAELTEKVKTTHSLG